MGITIVDSICGSGKTQWAITAMQNSPCDKPYMYITPFLSEVARIKHSVTSRTFYEPHPYNTYGSKYKDFESLLVQGKNIVTTHSLFTNVQLDMLNLIRCNEYTLILDEVMDVLDNYYITKKDWDMLYNTYFTIEEHTNRIVWTDANYRGKHEDLMHLSLANSIYLHSRTAKDTNTDKTLLVWTFPINIFTAFAEVYILTYMYAGQLQRYYFDMYNTPYTFKNVQGEYPSHFELCEYTLQSDQVNMYKSLIELYEGELNTLGNEQYSLSKAWLTRGLYNGRVDLLKKHAYNYFRNIVGTPSTLNMWTTLKGVEAHKDIIRLALSGKGYSKGFIPCVSRATNDYSHKTTLAYLLNRYLSPLDTGFFEDKGITIDENTWALSELLQWIFRSCLRNKKKIHLYLPSLRMRNLLKNWWWVKGLKRV